MVSPPQYYEVNGEVCKLTPASLRQAGGVANILVVAAITGKRIRVMGFVGTALGAAASNFNLKDGSGGSAIIQSVGVPADNVGLNAILPIVDCGYAETSTGVGLYSDSNAGGVNATIFYIAYTP